MRRADRCPEQLRGTSRPPADCGWPAARLDSNGAVRSNFRPRPYPRHTAGVPVAFGFDDGRSSGARPSLVFTWDHHPELGATEIFIPNTVFPPGSTIATSAPGLYCQRDEARQLLVCQGQERRSVTVQVRVRVP